MHTLKGPPAPTPEPTGSTTHHLTTLIHPQSYNTHTLKGPLPPTPLPPTHRKYHPPSYNTHTLKGPPTPLPPTHRKYHPPSYNTHTLKGPPPPAIYPQPTGSTTHNLTTLIHQMDPLPPTPLPPTHRKYHPTSYNTHTPTILQYSYTKGTPHPQC